MKASWISQLRQGAPEERFAAADALERESRLHPAHVQPYKADILEVTRATAQPGVQWHLAQLLPRLTLTPDEASEMGMLMERWATESPSSIVKADALTAISGLAHQYAELMPQAQRMLAAAVRFGSPAERARARQLVKREQPPEV